MRFWGDEGVDGCRVNGGESGRERRRTSLAATEGQGQEAQQREREARATRRGAARLRTRSGGWNWSWRTGSTRWGSSSNARAPERWWWDWIGGVVDARCVRVDAVGSLALTRRSSIGGSCGSSLSPVAPRPL